MSLDLVQRKRVNLLSYLVGFPSISVRFLYPQLQSGLWLFCKLSVCVLDKLNFKQNRVAIVAFSDPLGLFPDFFSKDKEYCYQNWELHIVYYEKRG